MQEKMRITLVTDTWLPSINGVVTTLSNTVNVLRQQGHVIQIIEPSQFKTVGSPRYPEVRLSWDIWRVGPMIEKFQPDAIHIATEGPLGAAARWYCKVDKRSIPHNTSYHTMFPEYLHEIYGFPVDWGYWMMRLFHKFSTRVLVTNDEMMGHLQSKGFNNSMQTWNRGVDRTLFNPLKREQFPGFNMLCVSRASREKGLDDFCSLQVAGRKILVGDGPYLAELKRRYPDVVFTGYLQGEALARAYASADVFVFPSKTDTFGVVMLEAMACGTPIAAYPVTGPLGVVKNGINGWMDDDLHTAVLFAADVNRNSVRQASESYDWAACTDTFLTALTRIPPGTFASA
jgi:glycosyltransferase involved in cell wall biosynthesis